MSHKAGAGTGQANPAFYYDAGTQLCVVLEPIVCSQYMSALQMPYVSSDECPADAQEWVQSVILSGYLNGAHPGWAARGGHHVDENRHKAQKWCKV